MYIYIYVYIYLYLYIYIYIWDAAARRASSSAERVPQCESSGSIGAEGRDGFSLHATLLLPGVSRCVFVCVFVCGRAFSMFLVVGWGVCVVACCTQCVYETGETICDSMQSGSEQSATAKSKSLCVCV